LEDHVRDRLRLDLGHAGDRLELGDEVRLRRVAGLLPGAVALEGLRDHDLEVEAAAADEAVHRHAVDLLELGQVLIQHFGAGLERRARRLVALVLAAPLAAHTVKLHGSIGQRHALLHHGSPLVHRRREGPSAGS
ncbi:unnamed protein product, partial [Pelagomonas calceolata]